MCTYIYIYINNNEAVPQECTTDLHHPSNHWMKVYQKFESHFCSLFFLDCQPPPPNNGMAWHTIIHRFQRLHELIELLHVALLNVELITKLSNVWMDPVSESLGWNPRNGMANKSINSQPLKWRNTYGKTWNKELWTKHVGFRKLLFIKHVSVDVVIIFERKTQEDEGWFLQLLTSKYPKPTHMWTCNDSNASCLPCSEMYPPSIPPRLEKPHLQQLNLTSQLMPHLSSQSFFVRNQPLPSIRKPDVECWNLQILENWNPKEYTKHGPTGSLMTYDAPTREGQAQLTENSP